MSSRVDRRSIGTGSDHLLDERWTVTGGSHEGYSPIGPTACSGSAPGCGYDSLNLGVLSFSGAPYIGTDVNEDVTFLSAPDSTSPLVVDTGWTGFRPLGEIRLN